MQKKLTITIDEAVYKGLHSIVGDRKISHFIEELVRPHVIRSNLAAAYQIMAMDQARENEASDWIEGIIQGNDIDETW